MLPRFLAPTLDPDTGVAVLPPDESHHLTRVLRIAAGDEVAVFDGRGHEFRARVLKAGRDMVRLALLAPIAAIPNPTVPLTLVHAVLKGAKMDDVVRDAAMLGVARVEPIVTARTGVKRASSSKLAERWRRVAIASAKQCRRATVPEVVAARSLETWLSSPKPAVSLLLVEPSAAAGDETSLRALQARETPASAAVMIGPEGGWAPEERKAAVAAGCLPVTLGWLTLRADVVALAAVAALSVVWGDTQS
ncbi:MAG: 16S rRNA (uracil(1498)-N(3))-methyltransferase [Acidobacteria bacterium]|nr:16S rRNA (uracil(1498)-N(3))-methyltransferase [Acidobacteriota bacterium]